MKEVMPIRFSSMQLIATIFAAALGYFVDGYDIVIFSVERVASLKALGLSGEEVTKVGAWLINCQMVGLLLGGVLCGIWSDKRGRLEALLGSIVLYSSATFANAYVSSVDQYAVCRFFGGLGLAGEIGTAITLVSEMMSKETRGYGTMIVTFMGLSGVAAAGLVGDRLDWQGAYKLGGLMGLALLILRGMMSESELFKKTRVQEGLRYGDLRLIFENRSCLKRFAACVLAGAAYQTLNVLFGIFAPEVGHALNLVEPVKVGQAMLYGGLMIALGGLSAGYLSQKIRTRKKILGAGISLACLAGLSLLNSGLTTASLYYIGVGVMGFFSGYWSVYLLTTAEQFGTNLRGTAATSIPNFSRAFVIIHTSLFMGIKESVGVIPAVEIILVFFTLVALVGVFCLRETANIDLRFVETHDV